MGEIADSIIEGIVCQFCGEYLGDTVGAGFPVSCAGCGGGDDCSFGTPPQESRKNKKARNKEWSTNHLREQGIEFQSFNNGIHLKVKRPVGVIDFWPTTGKYKRPDGSYGRGIKNMLKETEQ